MPNSGSGVVVSNDFRNGLITEATGLNFPENACTETLDCIHELDGSVSRRLGIDFEVNAQSKAIDSGEGVYTSFLWRDVAGDGDTYILAVQTGGKLIFYDASTAALPVSSQPFFSSLELTAFTAPGAPDPSTKECQFSSGNGLLFVTHPYLEPFFVAFTSATKTFTGTLMNVTIRDVKGMDDTTDPTQRTQTNTAGVSTTHLYNLLNQGWAAPSSAVPPVAAVNLIAWDTGRTDLPSDCDVMWSFKNASDVFDISTVQNVIAGNTPAPKGHYLLNPFNENRQDLISGIASEFRIIPNVTTSYFRPTANTFHAGRVFLAGIPYIGYSAKIYFSQIVEKPVQYGYCYQLNDPTAENEFDLLSSDGGVIDIQGAGTIVKMFPVAGGLAVFCTNGVWLITGSQGIGFSATDYSVDKISSIRSLTSSSFIDLGGQIVWWNLEGIYTLTPGGNTGVPQVQSITHDKILSFFVGIPPSSKRFARGYYNTVTGVVQWLYNSTEAVSLAGSYEYDHIFNFNTITGSFYIWRLNDLNVKIHDLVVIENLGGSAEEEQVVDINGVTDIVDPVTGQEVTVFSITDGVVLPVFKYLCHYTRSGQLYMTIGEERDDSYLDWFSFDRIGIDYTSTFTTGYRIRGEGIRQFSPVYFRFYSDNQTQFYVKGLWDYSTSGDTGRWSPQQLINNTVSNYGTVSTRLKIRGRGLALQLKIESVTGQPFSISGWSEYSIGNKAP